MGPEDSHLADAVGHLCEAVHALDEGRGLRGRYQAERARDLRAVWPRPVGRRGRCLMPVGMKGAPECARRACYNKIYKTGDDGQPLCAEHYREVSDNGGDDV